MKKRKLLIVILVALFGLLLLSSVLYIMPRSRVIGSIEGPEMNTVVIADQVYDKDVNDPFGSIDKGECIGRLEYGDNSSYAAYKVRGDKDYIYVESNGRGAFYKRSE